MKKNTFVKAILVVVTVGLMAGGAKAIEITLGVGAGGVNGDLILGEGIPLITGNGGLALRDTDMLNAIIPLGLGERTVGSADGTLPQYYRSTTYFGELGEAVFSTSSETEGIKKSGDFVTLTLGQKYEYLTASYDGPNGGMEAWYIGGLNVGDTILFPNFAHPVPIVPNGNEPIDTSLEYNLVAGNNFGLTSWGLFNGTSVPDGGLTVGLLGMALGAMGILMRKIA